MDIPSLFMIPSAVSSGKVHSVFPNSTDADFDFARSSTASRVNSNGLIESVASGQARLNYEIEGGLVNTKPSLLLEPQRTNAITNSDSFGSTGWSFVTRGTAIAPIVTDNYAISPDGTQNAQRVQFNLGGGTTTTDRTIIRQNIGSQTDWFLSVWMKSTNGTDQTILWHVGGDGNETTVTGQWKRYILSQNSLSNSWAGLALRGSVSTVNSADILVYGFQAEQGSYSTSLIPTSGSTQTRAAETCNGAGTSSILPSEEGVLYCEIAALSNTNNFEDLSLSDGTSANKIQFFMSSTNIITARVTAGNSTQFNHSYTSTDITKFTKYAIKYKANNFSMYVNGVQQAVDTSGTTFSANSLNTLIINDNNISDFKGKIRDIRVYNTKEMTDSEVDILLTKITS